MEQREKFEVTSAALHSMAMVFMLCDHLWATIIPGNGWLTCVGRLAFPIFAFMIVEGYFHTSNLKKYVKRMLLFAVISEIPFNLMTAGSLFYPLHQNVMFTFLIGILLIWLNEEAKRRGNRWLRIIVGISTGILGYLLGMLTFVDYYFAGPLTVLVFYFFRGRKWWCYLGQFGALWVINVELLGGLVYPVMLFGREILIVQQGFALLALIPIWLYRGKQGYHSKWLQYTYYAFYPAHMLVLSLLQIM